MVATEARPMSDMHGKCQALRQGTLPEQARYLASCQKYATLKPDGFSKNIKGYGPHVKNCRDRLKSGGPPWISTTKKSSVNMGNDRVPSQSAEQPLKIRIIRLASIPQSASWKITRSTQHFDYKDQ